MSRDRLLVSVLGVVLAACGIVFVVWRVWFFSAMPRTLTHLSFDDAEATFALAPDGRAVAYAVMHGDDRQLFVRRLDKTRPRRLRGTEGATEPFFSPDGSRLGFRVSDHIEVVPFDGGTPRVICECAGVSGARWTERGIFLGTRSGVRLVSKDGTERAITSLAEGEIAHRFPEPIPGTEWVVFEVATEEGKTSRLDAFSMATGERHVLVDEGAMPRFAPTGHLLYRLGGALWAAGFVAATGELQAPPILALEAVGPWFDVSGNGTLAFQERVRGEGPILVSVVVHWTEELARRARYSRNSS